MPFTNSVFLLIFLPTVLLLYFIAESFWGQSRKTKKSPDVANAVIAISSIVFLGVFDHQYAAMLTAATTFLIGTAWVVDRAHRFEDTYSRHTISAIPELDLAVTLTAMVLL